MGAVGLEPVMQFETIGISFSCIACSCSCRQMPTLTIHKILKNGLSVLVNDGDIETTKLLIDEISDTRLIFLSQWLGEYFYP